MGGGEGNKDMAEFFFPTPHEEQAKIGDNIRKHSPYNRLSL